jgi:hypothetical protein
MDPKYIIRDEAPLVDLYGQGSPASLVKEVDHVHPHYRAFIEASSFAALHDTRFLTAPNFPTMA